jgi:uracil-DNA glycosylase
MHSACRYVGDDMDWLELDFFKSDRLKKIAETIYNDERFGKVVLPPHRQIFRALFHTPPDNVKVVILGQDPYPTEGHANGLCFSVSPGVHPLPKSLQNIFKELNTDLGTQRTNGDLTDWADQGVLLLNTTLTVIKGHAGSHRGIGWEVLTTEIIRYLSEYRENLVYILWGKHAQSKEIYINSHNNLIIKSSHPSPLSAYRGFFGSKPFSTTNKYLNDRKIKTIKW